MERTGGGTALHWLGTSLRLLRMILRCNNINRIGRNGRLATRILNPATARRDLNRCLSLVPEQSYGGLFF